MPSYTHYKKTGDYSHTVGIYPTIELLKHRPSEVARILVSSDSISSTGVAEIADLADKSDIQVVEADRLIKSLGGEKANVVGVFHKYQVTLSADGCHIVLVNPSYYGNLGTIIRSMVGFDIHNLAIIEPAADIFAPEVVRASMGALFHINFQLFHSFNEYQAEYLQHKSYPFTLEGRNLLHQTKFDNPCSLIFGNEGSGLPASFDDMENSVRIGHTEGIDSLNLGVASTLAMYEHYNQK